MVVGRDGIYIRGNVKWVSDAEGPGQRVAAGRAGSRTSSIN